jgi:predicted permease
MNLLRVDILQALRSVCKSPGYALTVVLTLSLAIGANSAIFTLANAFLLSHLPVSQPDGLLQISTIDPKLGERNLSIPAFQALQGHSQAFASWFLWLGGSVENLEMNGQHFAGAVDEVGGDYYETLGVRPAAGRLITREDIGLDHFKPSQVAVIGYRDWQERYGGDPNIIGKEMLLDGRPFTIIGVHPKTFGGLIREVEADVTIPITASAMDAAKLYDFSHDYYTVIARLRNGFSEQKAESELRTIWSGIRTSSTANDSVDRARFAARRIQIQPAATGISYLRTRFLRPLYILLGLVGLLLLLACVNLATLSLARAHRRAGEYSVRSALGASRSRLMMVSLTESIALALAGVLPALAIAYGGSKYLGHFMWHGLVPLAAPLEPDIRIVAFTTAAAALAAILFGAVAAWKNANQEAGHTLKAANTKMSTNWGLPSKILVTGQIALSFSILAVALLFSRSLYNLFKNDPGFASNQLLATQLFPRTTYSGFNNEVYFRELLQSLKAIPGVAAATMSHDSPIGRSWKEKIRPGDSEAVFHLVAPDFLETLQIPLLRGREFGWQDDTAHRPVAILSAKMARRLFPDGDAVGRSIEIGDRTGSFEIVGIAGDATLGDPRVEKAAAVYACIFQKPELLGWSEAILRTSGPNPARLTADLQKTVAGFGREYASNTGTVTDQYAITLTPERMLALLTGFFGVAGLLLAGIGIYGLLSYLAAGREKEFGIRGALGANKSDLAGLVIREIATRVLVGLLLGFMLTLMGTRALSSVLFGLSAHDSTTLALAGLVLLLVASAASAIPALRAAQIDPASALRSE